MRLLLVAALAASSAAAGPREDFKAAVAAVQQSPSDAVLREKAIAAARKLKPAPAIPKEAQKRMIRGAAAVEGAKTPADFRVAAVEFAAATAAAPWWGHAYYNLGVAQDKAEDYDDALRSLKLASLATPGNADAEKLSIAVEFRKEKASSPEALAAKQKAKDDALMSGLEGAVFFDPTSTNIEDQYRIVGGRAQSWARRLVANYCNCSDTSRCSGPVGEESQCEATLQFKGLSGEYAFSDGARALLDIAEDGQTARMRVHSPRVGWLTDKTYKRR